MTQISFTSGELLDIISSLRDKEQHATDADQHHLASYYFNIQEQFERIYDKLQDLPGENRVANLVLAMN